MSTSLPGVPSWNVSLPRFAADVQGYRHHTERNEEASRQL
jgi:hypothetical protein